MTTFWDEVRELFQDLAERPPDQRHAVLQGTEPRLRSEVESLLEAHDETEPFLEKSVWQLIEGHEAERLTGSLIGPYRVVRQLGHGGMGTVFLATRETAEFSQRVAVKLMRGGEALVRRFRQERQILASLEHPNVARLIDGGTTADGVPYLVMEYIDGIPIDEFSRTLPVAGKIRLFLQLCEAVQHVHRNLIVHRDLKPANVLVTPEGGVRLLDFGIAKLTPEIVVAADATPTRMMTPQYASPEQLLFRVVTTASDVYSLGALLFELLTGEKPFDAATRRPDTEPPRPSSRPGSAALRGDLDNIVLTAMAFDPVSRYGSAEKLADDLTRYLSGHPVSARQATFGYRAGKFIRRNKLGVAAALAFAIVIAVAFTATLHQKRIAERRFDEVRSLAGDVVVELHDAIAPLPGSTPARELLVRRALVYLDRLGSEAEGNHGLRMELAGAYLKIGDVQGLPYAPNLGDTAGARASYQKALAFAASVHQEDPADPVARRLLADASDRLGFIEQRASRLVEAYDLHERARVLRESLPRDPARDIALARTWTAIGDCRYIGGALLGRGRTGPGPQQAYEAALAILDRVPPGIHDRELLRERGRAHQRLGGFHTGGHAGRDLRRAIEHHDAALRALEETARRDPSDAVSQRNWGDQFVMKATAQNMMGDGAGALESTTRGLEVLTSIASADPHNVEAQHDLAFAYSERGKALVHLDRVEEAFRDFTRAVQIGERLVADDPTNAEERNDLRHSRALLDSAAAAREHQ